MKYLPWQDPLEKSNSAHIRLSTQSAIVHTWIVSGTLRLDTYLSDSVMLRRL